MDSRPGLADLWDSLLFVLLLPAVVVLGVSLPGDWAHHQGKALVGEATVTKFERVRGGDVTLVDVRSSEGVLVARDQEVNGDSVDQIGAAFPVEYLPIDDLGGTQVYAVGHDPFITNLAVSAVVLSAWLISVPFVAVRLVKGVRRIRNRNRGAAKRYSAGRRYVSD